ncbi:CobW family GTP-binding protein [Helicobacter pylori]|uniref:CobW family GTP-binding protein n=1 Tax=Helicobacter pylori TaxID=210 RepID=UPI0002BB56B0|nr:GTP-binding protein [Helicobacter pylori]AKE81701.1 ATP-binding protein [Helicobacter pylori J99]AVL48918.1 GTP-binding protein [Helicobacter pylori]EMH10315.1 CobW/P47K family protein [Helicobacter pylori GAM250AFi]EMH14649.1 CobW/P47K family protein [Helicobacter pylori GAM252Bi]EMH14896.1 CobW/P47K family protein [Helicobacter pylori GAM250T]
MPKIPITLITGFLGSGKTSFLSEYLNQIDHQGVALIINEIGQAALDQRILSVQYCGEKMLYLNAGCVCCNKRLDLVESLKATLNNYEWRGEILKRVIIETTGLANPAPILWTILSDVFLGAHFEIQSVVACVDVLNAKTHLTNNEAKEQIVFADSVLLTKTDLQNDSTALMKLKERIQSLNPSAEIFDKKNIDYESFFSRKNGARNFMLRMPKDSHSQGFETLSVSFEGTMEWSAFGIWLSLLLHQYGTQILRIKGIIDIGSDLLVSINGVMHVIYPPKHILKDQNGSNLVFIVRHLGREKILNSLKGFKDFLGIKGFETP